MGRAIDESGLRYGRLVVLGPAGSATNGCLKWACVCDCGNRCVALGINLRSGGTRSCGCLKRDRGERSPLWAGDMVSYHALHAWVGRHKEKKRGVCAKCGAASANTVWGNISGEYHRDLDDFRELCRRCNRLEEPPNLRDESTGRFLPLPTKPLPVCKPGSQEYSRLTGRSKRLLRHSG